MRHKLVVLEGIDGVGKTTLAENLTAHISAAGIPCVYYEKSPLKSSLLSPDQKRWARERATIEESFHLYVESTLHKAAVVAELLEKSWVVMDRYVHSVLVHHLALGLDPCNIERFKRLPLLKADHTVLVTLPESLRLQRLRQRPGSTTEECVLADDESTFLGRKLAWFSKLIRCHVSNAGEMPETIELILRQVRLLDQGLLT